jgi:NitT/TauT family transport system ATP-binding protein
VSSTIVLEALTKSFGGLAVVEPLDLQIAPGTFVSIVGPSGCGKSTLLRMIAGLERPSAGTVTIDGDTPDRLRAAKRLAIVPQQPGLLPWRTVGGNARLLVDLDRRRHAPHVDRPDPDALLAEVGLSEFTRSYPHQLSGGMQQRVALVRGFSLGAPLLVMDEPFAALDEISRTDMRTLLARMLHHHPATVVFVTHSIPEAVFLSDRVLVCSPRPTRVVADITVDIGRPRSDATEDDPRFAALCADLRHRLRAGFAA